MFGVCYFTIAVLTLPDLSSTERILFTNAIFVLPAIKKFFNARTRESYLNLLGLTTLLVDLGGLVWGIYKVSIIFYVAVIHGFNNIVTNLCDKLKRDNDEFL